MASGGANERVYVSPVAESVNVGKDEGLRFPGWTGAVRCGREEGRSEMEKKFSAPFACPSMRDCVRGSYIYAIHYVFE